MEIGYMEPGILATLPEGVLFYPCSGHDLLEPVSRFAPAVKEFWFVDMQYHFDVTGSIDTITESRLKVSAFDIINRSGLHGILDIQGISFSLPVATRKVERAYAQPWSEPVDVICHCLHKPSRKMITVHLRRGCGLRCLEKNEFEHVSVFFYRGDSTAEGGSGHMWLVLGAAWFSQLVGRMPNGSLLVTDGSNRNGRMRSHLGLDRRINRWDRAKIDANKKIKTGFQKDGHSYRLVGRVSDRYGPTCVWQYTNVAMLNH